MKEMQRRNVLAAVAMGSLGLAAGSLSPRPAEASGSDVGEAELDNSKFNSELRAFSLATSRMAFETAADPKVRRFAGLEISEQETVADILRRMRANASDARGEAPKQGDAEVEMMIASAGMKSLARLRAASGPAFDRMYVELQLAGHKDLLAVQDAYIRVGTNREQIGISRLARSIAREHLSNLETLHSELG